VKEDKREVVIDYTEKGIKFLEEIKHSRPK